jgi:hypothetical protein
LNRFDFIIDDDSTATVILDPTVSHVLSGSKFLSGVEFYTGGIITYGAKIDNLYKNTYYKLADAITYKDVSILGNSVETQGTLNSTNYVLTTSRTNSLGNCAGDESLQVVLSGITFSVNSQVRRFNDPISLNLTARRTVAKGSRTLETTGGDVTVSNVYLDSYNTPASGDEIEYFNDETKRLRGNNSYNTYGVISSNGWDSTKSILNSDADHQNGLQVLTGKLIYPQHDFNLYGDATTNLNYGDADLAYNSCVGVRTYVRWFRQVLPTTANFVMKISGSGTFIPVSQSFTNTSNQIKVEIKAPGASSQVTGWLDCYDDFATEQWSDGAGARNATTGAGRAMGVNWGLTIGTKNTADTSGYMILKITVPLDWTGEITQIEFNF